MNANYFVISRVTVLTLTLLSLFFVESHQAFLHHQVPSNVSSVGNVTFNVRKCCAFNTQYRPDLDDCSYEKTVLNNESYVFQTSERETVRFSRDSGFSRCPEGTVHAVSRNFQFLPNGSLILPADGGQSLDTHEYCFEQSFESSSNTNELLVRYCSPDPNSGVIKRREILTRIGEAHELTCIKDVTELTELEKGNPYVDLASTLFLIFTLIVYTVLPELRNRKGILIIWFLCILILHYLSHSILRLWGDKMIDTFREINIFLIFYTGLTAFAWLNVIALDMWRTFRSIAGSVTEGKKPFFYYFLYGLGFPLLFILLGEIFDKETRHQIICSQPESLNNLPAPVLYFFDVPALFAVIVNSAFLIMTTCSVCRSYEEGSLASSTVTYSSGREAYLRRMQRMRVTLFLFVLIENALLLTTEVISLTTRTRLTGYIVTDIFDLLNGASIFVMFVCKPRIFKLLKRKFGFES